MESHQEQTFLVEDANLLEYATHNGREYELQQVVPEPDDTFTVQQAVNIFGFGWFHVKLSLLVGLCWMADSMEITMLSIIGPSMQYEWNITKYQQAFTTTVVFFGMMISSTFWMQLSDRYGRKSALSLCSILLVLYNLLSSVAPSFLWLFILRGLVGFTIGCVPQSVTLYAEFLPSKHKGKCVILMDCFWTLGACFEIVLALIVFPNLGWRWLLGLSTTPLLIFILLTPWLTESARFHSMNGRKDNALSILQQIAKDNKRHMLMGRLLLDGENKFSRNIKIILKPGIRSATILLWFIWMSCAFCYYGLVLMSTEIILLNSNNISISESFNVTDFMHMLWITFSEFPGIFLTNEIIRYIGGKNTMATQFIAFCGCLLLLIVTTRRVYNTAILFIARSILSGLFQAAYTYTPELYSTNLKSIGISSCTAFARCGAMATPFIAQVLLDTSKTYALLIYCTISACSAISCLFLPNLSSTT